jgi:hypothetical protein
MAGDWLTVAIAILALVVAFLSLGWQVLAFLQSGSRAKVELGAAIFPGTQGEPNVSYSITVRSIGRTGVQVGSWGLTTRDGKTIVVTHWKWPESIQPRTPLTVEPGHSVTWYLPMADLFADLTKDGVSRVDAKAFADLGTGERAKSSEWADVGPHHNLWQAFQE